MAYTQREVELALENYHEIYCSETMTGISYEGEKVDCTTDPSITSYKLIRKIDIDMAIDLLEEELETAVKARYIWAYTPAKIKNLSIRYSVTERTIYNRASKGVEQITSILNGNIKQLQKLLEEIGK